MNPMDELKKAQPKTAPLTASTQPGGSNITITETEKVTPIAPSADRIQAIKDMYDKNTQANVDRINSNYESSKATAEANRDKLAPEFQNRANELAVQYERNRRNFNQQADSRGLNTGAASQAALAQNSEYLRNFGALRGQETDAVAEANRNLLEMERKAKADAAIAYAEGDRDKAAAIKDAFERMQVEKLNEAKILGQFGNFSGFAEIWGKEKADAMQNAWNAQNPLLAYNVGNIDANRYHQITGEWPPGYVDPGAGTGGGGYWNGGGPGGPDDDTEIKHVDSSTWDTSTSGGLIGSALGSFGFNAGGGNPKPAGGIASRVEGMGMKPVIPKTPSRGGGGGAPGRSKLTNMVM